MPRRRITAGSAGLIALLEAIASLNLVFIDLALVMTRTFVAQNLPSGFLQ